ncbi:hypothetical protein BCR36DRAFT_584824 [Piromyces finnis]|uniref:Uncharacterized protein n=1 Tax=Piromyces finnis TaxID=1754191 RepID=A0A1Y1V4S7_9FUNG|nr:hypothetical protein BCR36DRAFT_584824 [Piromyces finnis]|eukprot:ORX47310.1 hypothetical protein BCR36DRAFT_584824 [Piromyces finnis]
MKAIVNAKDNENNMSNVLMNKTIKKTSASFKTGESGKKIKIDINDMSSDFNINKNKKIIVNSPAVSSPLTIIKHISKEINQKYQEEEEEIDNFNDIDCDELENKLDLYRNHDESFNSINNKNNLYFGTYEDLCSSSNFNSNSMTTSYSLKNISTFNNDIYVDEKKNKKKKHITINGPITFPNSDDKNNISTNGEVINNFNVHKNNSTPNTPVSTLADKVCNLKYPFTSFILKKKLGKRANKSSSVLDNHEDKGKDDNYLYNNHFDNAKNNSFNMISSYNKNINNHKGLSESVLELYDSKENTEEKQKLSDENKIGSPLGEIVDLDISSIKKSNSNPKIIDNTSRSISQSTINYANNMTTVTSDTITGTIHNLNNKNGNKIPIEIYDDEDFDFSGIQENQTLKLNENLMGSNSSSSYNSINFNPLFQKNSLNNDVFNNINKISNSNNSSKNNSNNHVEVYDDEDFDFTDLSDQKLKIDEKLLRPNANNQPLNLKVLLDMKEKSDDSKLPYNTISLSTYLSTNPDAKKKNGLINKNMESYIDDDFDDFDSQDVKTNLDPNTSCVDNDAAVSKSMESKKSMKSVNQNNNNKFQNIEIYDDNDFDFTDIGNQPIKIDEKLLNPNRGNPNMFNPYSICEINNIKGKSNDSKTSMKTPYQTISLNSFHSYLTKDKFTKDNNLTNIINNEYENLLSETKHTFDDTFSLSSNDSDFLSGKSESAAPIKKNTNSKSSSDNSNIRNQKEHIDFLKDTTLISQTTQSKIDDDIESKDNINGYKDDNQKDNTHTLMKDNVNNINPVYRCDSLKAIIFQKFFGIEPKEDVSENFQETNDEAYHCLLDELTDIISNGIRNSASEDQEKTKDVRKIIADINQRGIEMRKAAHVHPLNQSSVFSSEQDAHHAVKGKNILKKKKRHAKKNTHKVGKSSNASSTILREMDFFKKNMTLDKNIKDVLEDNNKKEKSIEEDKVLQDTQVESEKPISKIRVSSDGSLIPNTFSEIFKQSIAVKAPINYEQSNSMDREQVPLSKSFNKSSSSRLQYHKFLSKNQFVLSDSMIRHINRFKTSSQENANYSIDNLFDSLQSQEILDKILSNHDNVIDNNSLSELLAAEFQSISDYDEETKFNLNSEPSLDNFNRKNLNASISKDKVKRAFKYIDSIRKTNLDTNITSPINSLFSSKRNQRSWNGYDKVTTFKRNHLYYTIMDIINDIKNDIFCNPWNELNEKLNKAILENIEWEESIQQFQTHWKRERQTFPELQSELEKWNDEYNEQMNIIEEYNRELKILDQQINLRKQRTKQFLMLFIGLIFTEIIVLFYLRFFIFTDTIPSNMNTNGFWLPYLKTVIQNIYPFNK